MRKRNRENSDPERERKSKTASKMCLRRKEEQETEEMTLATTDKSWQAKCNSVDKGRRGRVWRPWGIAGN